MREHVLLGRGRARGARERHLAHVDLRAVVALRVGREAVDMLRFWYGGHDGRGAIRGIFGSGGGSSSV